MGTVKKRHLCTIAIVLFVPSTTVFIFDVSHIREANRLNEALRRGDYVQAASYASTHGVFANGYVLQQKGEFDQAFKVYSEVDVSKVAELESALTYNMANLYLQQASKAKQNNDMDLAIPLIELAKQNYRKLLYKNSRDWSAKYNLERALLLLPDLDEHASNDDVMPERSPEAAGSIEVYDQLP